MLARLDSPLKSLFIFSFKRLQLSSSLSPFPSFSLFFSYEGCLSLLFRVVTSLPAELPRHRLRELSSRYRSLRPSPLNPNSKLPTLPHLHHHTSSYKV
ncbi:hypothetical protein HZ326_24753 [Fusarium oxysporum f. sp. albedinis]|nr:hypothetical protein HZ326_24753 [Fusarium oxysporum f. sp. albedinis]